MHGVKAPALPFPDIFFAKKSSEKLSGIAEMQDLILAIYLSHAVEPRSRSWLKTQVEKGDKKRPGKVRKKAAEMHPSVERQGSSE